MDDAWNKKPDNEYQDYPTHAVHCTRLPYFNNKTHLGYARLVDFIRRRKFFGQCA